MGNENKDRTFEDVDFDLPKVDKKKVVAPRVHIAGDVCISCEG